MADPDIMREYRDLVEFVKKKIEKNPMRTRAIAEIRADLQHFRRLIAKELI